MARLNYTEVWNFVTGCTQISSGCDNCYAMTISKRLQETSRKELDRTIEKLDYSKCTDKCMGINIKRENDQLRITCQCKNTEYIIEVPKYYYGWGQVVLHKSIVREILDTEIYPSGSKICVCNYSDLFHESISDEELDVVFEHMLKRKDLTFQLLTKRPERMMKYIQKYMQTDNKNEDDMKHIWFGISAENQIMLSRRIYPLLGIKKLLNQKVKVFLSIEPMIEEINLEPYKKDLDWVVVGGEVDNNDAKGARMIQYEWVENLYHQCQSYGIAFFLKQWGSNPKNRPEIINFKSTFPQMEEEEEIEEEEE